MSARTQAVVVGAGPGLGRSIAQRAAREGHDVALLGRTEATLRAIADELAPFDVRVTTRVCDVADLDGLDAAIADLAREAPIEVLSVNAVAVGGRLIETPPADLERATRINVLAPIVALRAALASLGSVQGRAMLTGGGLALFPSAALGLLSLGKGALHQAVPLLAEDARAAGVRVRSLVIAGAIEPGTAFDPDTIADAFWEYALEPDAEPTRVFDGT
jgi:NAD(P)-dependent dehydrogenase (short-subunit alcohol dehydrogenase family)